jgi:septal ring factor EnvC (AmiA/AmiB activator)
MILLVLFALHAAVPPEDPGRVRAEVEEEIRREADLRKDLGRREEDIQKRLSGISSALQSYSEERRSLQQELARTRGRHEATAGELRETRRDTARRLLAYNRCLSLAYRTSRLSPAEQLFSGAGGPAGLDRRVLLRSLRAVLQNQAARIRAARERAGDLEGEKEALARLSREYREKSDETARKLGAQSRLKTREEESLSVARQEALFHDQRIKVLQATSRNLELLVRSLQEEQSTGNPDAVFARSRGRLPWPLPGKIETRYGRYYDSAIRMWVDQEFVDIRPAGTKEVRAVAGGKVEFTGWLRGYGNTVVVRHGKRFATIYAMMESILVQPGAQVRAGTQIGRLAKEDALRFCIALDNDKVDPEEWLAPAVR